MPPTAYTATNFPAGEAHISITEDTYSTPRTQIATLTGCDANELFQLAMWADACERRGEPTVLLIPYLPGARADRGTPLGASIYANFLNSMNLNQVITMDPHSPVMPSLLNNLTILDSAALIRHHVVGRPDSDQKAQRYTGIIAPDAGAVARAQHAANVCRLPLYRALKHRDPQTGRLSGFSCEPLPRDGKFLVVDDICDGGGTFMGLADATGLPKEQLGLWVTHGVFSGRAKTLTESYGSIFTTDSYPSRTPYEGTFAPTVVPLRSHLLRAITEDAFTNAAPATQTPVLVEVGN